MSDKSANFPLEQDVTIAPGEMLTLTFTQDCHPCWDKDDAGMFDHHLPRHDHKKGHVWTGTATKAGTVDSTCVPYGGECPVDKKHRGTTIRSIQVG